MQLDYKSNKGFRLLSIYESLNKGEVVSKAELANRFNVTLKTIQRDIDDLRAYIANNHPLEGEFLIQYDRVLKGYYLVRLEREWLTSEDILAITKILLESRSLCKKEMDLLVAKLLSQVSPTNLHFVKDIICNEQFLYIPPRHNKEILHILWELSQYILHNQSIEIEYTRQDQTYKKHRINPVAIMFSEYYFYLIAFITNACRDFPTIFRVDRIISHKATGEKYYIPYKNRFSDGEFRKRVQFMYSGELRTVRFKFSGPSVEAILDRFPTALVNSKRDGVYDISVESYGNGIEMWLRTQGGDVTILS